MSNWKQINWNKAYVELKAMQAKLYGALKTNASIEIIKSLHNEILTSFAARAIAVRIVTTNKGKNTHGTDKVL
jgi:RNA-directed DNA polymerase